jgi:DNA repair exonuclease SbcCD ATPase subunit
MADFAQTESELVFAVEQAHKAVDMLKMENEVLGAYFSRCGTTKDQDDEESKGARGKKKRESEKEKKRPVELTLEQKSTIAAAETDELKEEIDRCKNHYESLLDKLKALMEETEVEMSEVKKEHYEFKRDVVGGERNFRSGKTAADKVMRFLEEKMREKDSLIDKLTLKNTALQSQTNKQQGLLQQKEEMGEVLHVIDFDQLKIENQQYNEKIEERNNELLKLKLTTGNIVQVLNTSKKRLAALTTESVWLRKSMDEREDQLGKIKEELKRLGSECAKAKQLNEKLITQLKQSRTPHVMEYISQKAAVHDLKTGIQTFERKVEIAEMEERRYRLRVNKALEQDPRAGGPGMIQNSMGM